MDACLKGHQRSYDRSSSGREGLSLQSFYVSVLPLWPEREREREAGRDGGRDRERIEWRDENSYPVLEAWAKNFP